MSVSNSSALCSESLLFPSRRPEAVYAEERWSVVTKGTGFRGDILSLLLWLPLSLEPFVSIVPGSCLDTHCTLS